MHKLFSETACRLTPRKGVIILSLLASYLLCSCDDQTEHQNSTQIAVDLSDIPWQADWITADQPTADKNVWLAFRRSFELTEAVPSIKLRLAVDTKYWLWVNGTFTVLEGGLKRGPTPEDTYFDEVNLSLKKGKNTIALLQWYFGKNGMTHNSSGQPGLIAEFYKEKELLFKTDTSWKAMAHPAFNSESADPQPNWRLPESNIVFDARKDITEWMTNNFDDSKWPYAKMLGNGITAPWNQLVKRPVPFWKDFGLTVYKNKLDFPFISTGDTIVCKLPYNAQVTPYLKVKAKSGKRITMLTDHYKGGSEYNMRAEYITKEGVQEFEALGWINGEKMYYVVPEGIEVLALKYRETGYNTTFAGSFECDDPFYNQLWQKALRTLYVTMRDNYMDCPDRERAQWWGDVVLESGEAFYALDRNADALTRKGMLELMNWQRPDSTIFSPVPAGNWDKELPGQMLASVGYYGFYNYYLHTGDLEVIRQVCEPVRKYLSLWKLKPDGSVAIRSGGWTWGDWGDNRDVPLLINTQYYLALKGFERMLEAVGQSAAAEKTRQQMKEFKESFNEVFWQGDHYRSAGYHGLTDDRSQGLAVVAGLADEERYESISQVLKTQKHASPYMEKYVLEALFQMGYEAYALERMKERFSKMVNHTETSTLWEGWGIGAEGYGGGTTNHAWSGGGLTLLSQYVAGISPVKPGYEVFRINPQLTEFNTIKAKVPSIKGIIVLEVNRKGDTYNLTTQVPEETKALICIPLKYQTITINGETFLASGDPLTIESVLEHSEEQDVRVLKMTPGKYYIEAF
ncbi:alpha-L-rhamnosidase C-terminal domain-containing protein [Fulvivirga sp. M361]|uniref:alpha-L-rhamnosidase-related protein n=1 Tax=Fulvivirga sp. M361 TaxID=2594266 RepID=UPI00162470E8|nr:alpha-L-rhamnosidase C-terminal domain-containing protein [Fulvivirga sp. M361]